MKYQLLFIITLLIFTFSLQAQSTVDRSNYKLLWEITGNGFEKPSYLFGSMHVEDERVFEFCDSMLVCLENSDGFSGELNMDSMIHFVMKSMFSEDTTNILKDILSPEAYEGLNNKLLNKEGKDIDDLSNKQPWIIEMMLDDDDTPESDSDFEAFLDMYLYNYAKKLGKETYGLEKIEDQLSLSLLKYETYQEYLAANNTEDTSAENSLDALEQLTQIYISGDIKIIDDVFVKPMPDDIYKQKLLTDRNIVMANNIELLGQQMGMFNVVGAAHLPGEMGVIELLKRKGFSLRPISPDFTGKSQFKDLSHVELPWKKLDRKAEMECIMEFPVDAVRIENIEGQDMSQFDYYISMDLQTQELYMYLGIDVGRELEAEEAENILDTGLQTVLEEGEMEIIIAPHDIEYKGIKGRSAKAKNEEGIIDGRAFVQGSKMYYLYVFKEKGEIKNEQRFFNSLEFHPQTIKKVNGEVLRKDYALSFEAPVNMKYSISEQYQLDSDNEQYPYPSIVHEYKGSDIIKDVFYSVRFYDMPEGTFTTDENAVINGMRDYMESAGMTQFKKSEKEILAKINRKEFFFERDGMYTFIGYFLRGSRFINAFVVAGSEDEAQQEYEQLVSSLYLLDFEKTEFSTQEIEELGISIKMPKNSQEKPVDYIDYPYDQNGYQLMATDTNSTAVFLLEAMGISPYYDVGNPDTLLLSLYESASEDAENPKNLKFLKQQGYHSIQFDLFNSQKTTVITRMQITLVDDWLIYAFAYLPRELYNTEYPDTFFNSLDINPSFKRNKSSKNKINNIAKDLNTTDDEIYEQLQNAIYNYEIKKENLTTVYTILKKEIPLDTSTIFYYSIKEQLIEKLEDINDENTIAVLEEIFPSSSMKEQLAILNTIGMIEDDELKTYWKLMNEINTEHEDFDSYSTIKHFYENLPIVVDNIPKIMELSEDELFTNHVYSLIFTLTDEVDINWENALVPYQKDMLALLEREFLEWKSVEDYGNVYLLQYLIIIQLELGNNEELYTFLEKNIADANGYLATRMAGVLLNNNIAIDDEVWNKIEAEYLTYAVINVVMNDNNKYDHHPLIPKKYKDQTYAAKMSLVESFEDDYDIKSIRFIRKEKIKKEGKKYNLYVFEIEDIHNPTYKVIGVSIQPINKKEYQFYPVYSNFNFYEKEDFDLEKNIKELMKSFYE